MLKKQINKVSCKVSFLLCILFLFSHYVYAENTQIVLGGKEGWSAFSYSNGVTTGTGRYGYDCIELATNSFASDEVTDLLIDFENPDNVASQGKPHEIPLRSFPKQTPQGDIPGMYSQAHNSGKDLYHRRLRELAL